MRSTFFFLFIITCSCTRLYTKKYPLINEKEIGFGIDKDSISKLTKINYVDLYDTNQTFYYLKEQKYFDSLILKFYQNKLYGYEGLISSKEKTNELYQFLISNFKGKKYEPTMHFESLKKNFYVSLTKGEDSLNYFVFNESNIYGAFIFTCGTHRRIYFWKNPYSGLNERMREKKCNRIRKNLK